MERRLVARFACEGELWNIYRRRLGNEVAFWSGHIVDPGGDDWVETISPEAPRLEDVLPTSWFAYNPIRIDPVCLADFRELYRRAIEKLSAKERHGHHYMELRDWQEKLGLKDLIPDL